MSSTAIMDSVRRTLAPLDADDILSTAMQRAGHEDLSDTPCEEALQVLVDACNTQADLSFFGQVAARYHLLDLLETWGRLTTFWKQTPEIQRQVIYQPIFITGLPRSGTTFLHNLLAQDPDSRVPRTWEVMLPFPPPTREGFDSDSRITKAENRLRLFCWTNPTIARVHPIGARLPQECIAIMSYSLQSDEFLEMFRIPSYENWLRTRDMGPAYRFHRSFLKHLQWRCPGERWVLKAPDHVHSLTALFETYPDARVVFLHRDPLKVLGSVCSLTKILRGAFSRRVDTYDIGADEADILAQKTWHMMEFRSRHPHLEERFIDIRYLDLIRDPIHTVRNIYERFRLSYSPDAETRMRGLLVSPQNTKRFAHTYDLAEFGLYPNRNIPDFNSYRKRFSVMPEPLS